MIDEINIRQKLVDGLTDFGKSVLIDRYLLKNEDFFDLFSRVAKSYTDDEEHYWYILNAIANGWFMPSTPILSNGGTSRGLPISCFLNECEDSLESIAEMWNESVFLASKGGGVGSYYGNIRPIGDLVNNNGKTCGIIPFIGVTDKISLAVSQGSLRRGSTAVYLPINHPEIFEFIKIRTPTGGDINRKSLNLHHAVCIDDKFMKAVESDGMYDLVNPRDGVIASSIRARSLWINILETRLNTGEPYIIFSDTVNRSIPEHHKKLGLSVKMSNLCSEITLPTGVDYLGNNRTAVCCLASLNIIKYEEWKEDKKFILNIMKFLDNVLQDFIDKAPDSMSRAKYSAEMERSVGLGVMGFHSYLQSKQIPFESVASKSINKDIFSHIKKYADLASVEIAKIKGPCPDAEKCGVMERFSNKTAIAPTASISIISGESSPGVEPIASNIYTHKTLSGSFVVKNKYLVSLLEKYGKNNEETWLEISSNQGSVLSLDFLSSYDKDVFKTSFEINQRWIVELAADRANYICQSQSINLFLNADISKKNLHTLHYLAWKQGVKSLYYCRSKSISRAKSIIAIDKNEELKLDSNMDLFNSDSKEYEECLACQ
jgi:ribonucleoside-diphosphate reductase alpha chain